MLFDKKYTSLALIMDDDVDLGPMSPLQYSSSPNENPPLPFDRSTKQTDFTNLFPGSLKTTTSPMRPFFDADKNVLVVEESVSSAVISEQGDHREEITTAIPMEENHKQMQEKTPSERMINCQDLRVSFKKSLILGDMVDEEPRVSKHLQQQQKRSYSMSVLTEKNSPGSASTSPKEKVQKLDTSDTSRARTSLTFDGISIPTSRFYSSQNDENRNPKRNSAPMLLPRDYNPHRSSGGGGHRSGRRSGGGIAQKGCSHKIKKPARAPPKEATKKKVELAVLQQHHQQEQEQPKEKVTVEDAQTTRLHEIMKNIKNPLEMSRPLFFTEKQNEDRFHISDDDEEEELAEAEKSKKKFFKSGTTGAKSYKLTGNVVATFEGGKMTLPKLPTDSTRNSLNTSAQDPAEFSMVDEEFGSEFEEVTGIISKLADDDEMDSFRSRIPFETTDPSVTEQQAELLEKLIANRMCTEENFKICIAQPEQHKEEKQRLMELMKNGPPPTGATPEVPEGLFPIFYHRQSKRKLVSLGERKNVGSDRPSRKVWKRIGDSQLQIDAGQTRFGATYCAECDLLYSVHEPEDEIMHERFHGALSVLRFSGWKVEDKILEVPKWGINGRIIAIPWNDHKVKVHRVLTVLNAINKEMGCPNADLKPKTIVYLAVAQNIILGVCVAEAKYEANRIVTENGVDYFSEEVHPVWCGVSRIWVAAPYRNQGVASELVHAVRTHFTIGRPLTIDDIAFQSPTEAGKLLGRKLANRQDFLVYP